MQIFRSDYICIILIYGRFLVQIVILEYFLFLLFVTLEASRLCCSPVLRRFQRDKWSEML